MTCNYPSYFNPDGIRGVIKRIDRTFYFTPEKVSDAWDIAEEIKRLADDPDEMEAAIDRTLGEMK